MSLNPVEEPVIDRSDCKVGLVHAESPFDKVQVAVALDDFTVRNLAIGHIALQSVQERVGGNLTAVNRDFRLAIECQELVVSPVVDRRFRYLAWQTAFPAS